MDIKERTDKMLEVLNRELEDLKEKKEDHIAVKIFMDSLESVIILAKALEEIDSITMSMVVNKEHMIERMKSIASDALKKAGDV